jgi:hypothetical protein
MLTANALPGVINPPSISQRTFNPISLLLIAVNIPTGIMSRKEMPVVNKSSYESTKCVKSKTVGEVYFGVWRGILERYPFRSFGYINGQRYKRHDRAQNEHHHIPPLRDL